MAEKEKKDSVSKRVDMLTGQVEELARLVRGAACSDDGGGGGEEAGVCGLPEVPERTFDASVSNERAALIRVMSKKWVNGTNLHYYFFDNAAWGVPEVQREVVRDAFKLWKDVGIGLDFTEVNSPEDAEIRIGYDTDDGSWSYVGRDVLNQGSNERTMNFGWDLRTAHGRDTAIHEIGHTLGFPHEHQNPKAGIVWDEEAVYSYFAGSPNFWSRQKTFHNVIRKINPDTIDGSDWDPDSIMHYRIRAGLIQHPTEFQTRPLIPAAGLSDPDKTQVQFFYPVMEKVYPELKPLRAERLSIAPGQQVNFSILPNHSRYYRIRTFGRSDTVMVLFEEENGDLVYVTGDDDSGTGLNASIRVRLNRNRRYVLRIRLYYESARGDTAVMMW